MTISFLSLNYLKPEVTILISIKAIDARSILGFNGALR